MGWLGPDRSDATEEVALGFYLALMTAESLAMIGAQGPVIVEGPFAQNPFFRRMLRAAGIGRRNMRHPHSLPTPV